VRVLDFIRTKWYQRAVADDNRSLESEWHCDCEHRKNTLEIVVFIGGRSYLER